MKLILLIDDDASIRLAFGMALRTSGYRVIEADSGETGMRLAKQNLPDLVLSDINMPGGDGQTLLHNIRADADLFSTQVVLMTGRPDLMSPRKGMEQGADDFLLKPVSMEALIACMEARLNRAHISWRVQDDAVSKLRNSVTSVLPHEVFTPLAGIIGLSEILCSPGQCFAGEELKEIHQDIHASAVQLHRTLRNYLYVMEIDPITELAEAPACLPTAKLRDTLREGVHAAASRSERADDIKLEWENCPLRARATDLAIIVEELVDNALKFSHSGTPVVVTLSSDGVLAITDAGRGMSDEEIEQIAAFRQFDRKTYEQQGLGLGLTLVQKLAARNGATFSIERVGEQGIRAQVGFICGAGSIP